ncbi:MAG TPA: ribonuclease H-like domain-containing protein [Anaerolineae bacterium]|nr:ribonuclease H-like domain-containing protein [Anaerolineae bacterium]HQI83695.1 ribonuclease H-like domain-containing protein [Anaerolineae bacterium]
MDDKFRQQLQRLGVVKGLKALQPAPQPVSAEPPRQSSAALPGDELLTPHGPVWVEKRVYPAFHPHGRYALGEMQRLPAEGLALLGVPSLGAHPAFLDTETTGLAGGAGTLVFLTGIGVWEDDHLTLHLVFLRSPDEETAAMHYIEDVLDSATGIVSFNGNGFDLPLLESRFILNRMTPRWRALPHLDLLTVARQLWRDHLESRRLGMLETEILRVQRAEADIESALIPWLYRQYLDTGDTADMVRVFYHNRIDVLSLVSLLVHVTRMVTSPEQMALAPGEWVGVGRVFDRAGREAEAVTAWERALVQESGTLAEDAAARLWCEMALRHKRCGAWDRAFALWDDWAKCQPLAVEPLVERAKYHEWTAGDLHAALSDTDAALNRAERHPKGFKRAQLLSELRHRKDRLERKLANGRIEESANERISE